MLYPGWFLLPKCLIPDPVLPLGRLAGPWTAALLRNQEGTPTCPGCDGGVAGRCPTRAQGLALGLALGRSATPKVHRPVPDARITAAPPLAGARVAQSLPMNCRRSSSMTTIRGA